MGDEQLKSEIVRVHEANLGVYGARKVWRALNRTTFHRQELRVSLGFRISGWMNGVRRSSIGLSEMRKGVAGPG